jgi:hypothetical protein
MLFFLTALSAHAAAAIALAVHRSWSQSTLRPLLLLGVGLLVYELADHRPWRGLGRARYVEDLGPLVLAMEQGRRDDDGVLVFYKSVYVFAYYQRRIPVLIPDTADALGFRPRLDGGNVALVTPTNLEQAIQQTFAVRKRVWFLASRVPAGEEQQIRRALGAHGRTLVDLRRPGAVLVLVERAR